MSGNKKVLTLPQIGVISVSSYTTADKKRGERMLVHRVETAENIVRLRREAGESQYDVARALGVCQGAVSSWERTGRMSLENAAKLASHFGVTVDELYGR